MTSDDDRNILEITAELRDQAKELLSAKKSKRQAPWTEEAAQCLFDELEHHQIELETQNVELLRTQQELETQQIELEFQNDELRRVHEELELSRNKYSELYDFAPIAYFTIDTGGVIQETNIIGSQMLGIEKRDLADKPFANFIADVAGREIFSHHIESVLQKQVMQRCDIRLRNKNGSMIYGQFQSVMVDSSERKGENILCSIVDGTVAMQLGAEIQDAREYAENIVETVRKPLVVLNSDLNILTANHCFYEFFMVTPEETIGKYIYDLGNRQWDIPKLRVLFEDILPNDSAFNGYVVEHDFPGVGHKTILLNARQIFRKNIGSHIILLAMEDITERRKLEVEFQDALEYAMNIVETVREPLLVLNADLKIISANHSFYETFKVSVEETIGNFIYDVGNRQWDIPKLRVLFEDILPNDTVFNGYEVEHDFPDIGRKTILLNAREIFRENIGAHIILLAMEDITERKQVEAERARLDRVLKDKSVELQRAKYMAEKANLAKSDFLSSMSHELRTPLSAILGFAQLMESGSPQPTPAQTRSIDQILKAGWYLLDLINEILDLALIESGRLSLSMEPVSLPEVMNECNDLVESQAKKYGVSVTFLPLEAPCFVKADRTRVKQVLINLLSNAIKYNTAGGTVVVENALSTTDSIRISIRDTGEGLTPEQMTNLFQPFNRLGQEANTEQGTGIGLVVSKRLVELMGGVIGVESTVGEGSVFWVEFNLTQEPHAGAHTAAPSVALEAQAPGDEPLYTLLYVEDNPANMMLVEELISRRPDIRFLSARDAIKGIEIACASLPDAILMDINLPGISGIDALKILTENPKTAHIPIVALSANAIPHDIQKGLEAGFFRYLTKPIMVKEFMETLDMVLKFSEEGAALAAKKGRA